MKIFFLPFIGLCIFVIICIANNNKNTYKIENYDIYFHLSDEEKNIDERKRLMEDLIINLFKLRNHLIKNKNDFGDYAEYINLLANNFTKHRTEIYENVNDNTEVTSYSVNKGEKLVLCLTDKYGKIHDLNTLMYVGVHELAHMACPKYGHGDVYKKIYRFFIREAISEGLYKYQDYSIYPSNYCGIVIDSNIF
jgi:hypothetical protein